MERVDDTLRELERQRRRLQPNQSRITRRNARRGFLGAMKALRNALNAEYPRIERPVDPEKFVVDIFEPAHREGHGRKSRMLNDRWRVVRRTDFAGYPSSVATFLSVKAKHGGTTLGALTPTNVRDATRFAAWCKKHLAHRTFRLRKVGEKEGLPADVL